MSFRPARDMNHFIIDCAHLLKFENFSKTTLTRNIFIYIQNNLCRDFFYKLAIELQSNKSNPSGDASM